MTLTLNKSIAAVHLNRKTGVPWSEPEATIPFGAVIQYVGADGNKERFTHMGELYRCPADVLASALEGGKIPTQAAAPAAKAAPVEATPAPEAVPESTLQFEALSARPYSIARAKVPGGWLLLAGTASLTFYPDPEHAWNGESLA